MENQEVPKLWEQGPLPAMRRPNPNPMLSPTGDIKTDDATHLPPPQPKHKDADFSILTTTRLRVDAKEWFPSSYTPIVPLPNIHSVQNRLQKIKIVKENNVSPEEICEGLIPNEAQTALDTSRLHEIVNSLTYDPGQFDNVIETFMAILTPYLEDIHVVSNIADMIFVQALYEPSFRYNAARLCSVIDEHCPLFRSSLHILCKKELESSQYEQGLTLFLAELYMQSHYENIYGRSLLTSIKNLISVKKPEDIKCICQALKLAGSSLHLYRKETLDSIFLELEDIRSSASMDSLKGLLDTVFELRQNQWGHVTPMTSTNSFPQEPNGFISSPSEEGFILYGPDGQEITSEERDFLQANFEDPNDYLGDESSDPDDLFDPEPEMDAEIQAAFREFVKMNKR